MLSIGKLAKATNASIDTLRYYVRIGLLTPDARSTHDYRMYEKPAINRVQFIKNAQQLGFSLSEIEKLLNFDDSDKHATAEVLKLTEEKIQTQEKKIKELQTIQTVLSILARQCPGEGPSSDCPILQYLYPVHSENTKTN